VSTQFAPFLAAKFIKVTQNPKMRQQES
jgi:hypothetical protein